MLLSTYLEFEWNKTIQNNSIAMADFFMNTQLILLLFASTLLIGCSYNSPSNNIEEPAILIIKKALIMGSAESPDPILQRVRQLELKGVVRDVVVLESFPVQIQLKAPQAVINELNDMSRVNN